MHKTNDTREAGASRVHIEESPNRFNQVFSVFFQQFQDASSQDGRGKKVLIAFILDCRTGSLFFFFFSTSCVELDRFGIKRIRQNSMSQYYDYPGANLQHSAVAALSQPSVPCRSIMIILALIFSTVKWRHSHNRAFHVAVLWFS